MGAFVAFYLWKAVFDSSQEPLIQGFSMADITLCIIMSFVTNLLTRSDTVSYTHLVAVHLDAKFGEVHIRLPHGCVMDSTGISHPLSSVKVDRFESDFEQVETRLHLSGSLFCTELEVEY